MVFCQRSPALLSLTPLSCSLSPSHNTMESAGIKTEPIANDTGPMAKQSFRDLFRWRKRVEIFFLSMAKHAMNVRSLCLYAPHLAVHAATWARLALLLGRLW